MTNQVYYLHSTLELPLEDLYDHFEDPDLPPGIESVEVTRRNNTLIVGSEAPEGTVGKYTPTAQIKGTVTETRIPDEEAIAAQAADESTVTASETGSETDRGSAQGSSTSTSSGPSWSGPGEEEPQPTKVIEVAAFKGELETILQNTALQYEMFQVLRDLALETESGVLTAITEEDGELVATRIVDGEERPASVKVVEDHQSGHGEGGGINWRDNKYIS